MNKNPYTPGFREVLKLSRLEVQRLGNDCIDPEHLLLAIIRKGDGLAIQILMNRDIDIEDLKLVIEKLIREKPKKSNSALDPINLSNLHDPLKISNSSYEVLDLAKKLADSRVQGMEGWVGTEHLLVALAKDETTIACRALKMFNLDYDILNKERNYVIFGSGKQNSEPAFYMVWDPNIVSKEDYAQLIALFGELARHEGALGIERIGYHTLGLPFAAEVTR